MATDAELDRIRESLRDALTERTLLRQPCERCCETGADLTEHILGRHEGPRGGSFHDRTR